MGWGRCINKKRLVFNLDKKGIVIFKELSTVTIIISKPFL